MECSLYLLMAALTAVAHAHGLLLNAQGLEDSPASVAFGGTHVENFDDNCS